MRTNPILPFLGNLSHRAWFGALLALLFFGALFWAKGRDPFHRIWFTVKTPDFGKAECIAVLPKTSPRPYPVVFYLHGSGGSFLESGNELRQIAEMGMGSIGMDYNQTNVMAFDAQLMALIKYVTSQKWADTNRVAWVGSSLGAQRMLSFTLKHPDQPPQLLVRLAGGWVSELEGTKLPRSSPKSSILIIHGQNDEIFPLQEMERVVSTLTSNATPVETKVLAGQPHAFGPNRLLVFRAIGEYCLTHLKGVDELSHYQSILSWQSKAKPLWLYWIPALLWILYCLYRRRHRNKAVPLPEEFHVAALPAKYALTKTEIALRFLAAILATAALAQTGLHLIPPRLPVSDKILDIARKHLIQKKEITDFDFLSTNPAWRGKRLKTLLTHVELANYNRELINWKLDDQIYCDFILSPQIDPVFDGDLDWRRELWENFYPRIRKQDSPQTAAEIVVRFLRERVTIVGSEQASPSKTNAPPPSPSSEASAKEDPATILSGPSWLPKTIDDIWVRQITDERGFEATYVAALRSAGIPARLNPEHQAEIYAGNSWQPAPRPLITSWPSDHF